MKISRESKQINTPLAKVLGKVLIAITLMLSMAGSAYAQTKGLIFKPAQNAGTTVLDPNGDGYASETSSGFVLDDVSQSEISMFAMPQVEIEPINDVRTGAGGGHTDIVDNGSKQSAFMFYDGSNLIFRVRIADQSTASKGYSFFFNTDFDVFGPKGGNYSTTNPGFQFEIVLETNNGVAIYDLNGESINSKTLLSPIDDYFQKAVSYDHVDGSSGIFYDFYVPVSEINNAISGSFSASTQFKAAMATITRAQSGITGTISDVNGINDNNYKDAMQGIIQIIDSFPPTSANDLAEGSSGFGSLVTPTATPGLDRPILDGDTEVSGYIDEEDGTTINVYVDGSFVGSTTSSGYTWTLSGLSALSDGQNVTARAQYGSKEQSEYSTAVTVTTPGTSEGPCLATEVSTVSIDGVHTNNGGRIQEISGVMAGLETVIANNPATTYGLVVYDAGTTTTAQVVDNKGAFISNAQYLTTAAEATVSTDGSNTWSLVMGSGNNGLAVDQSYEVVLYEDGNPSCIGARSATFESLDTATQPTYVPSFDQAAYNEDATSVSGTVDGDATQVNFYKNGKLITNTSISGSAGVSEAWTISGQSFVGGDKIYARAIASTGLLTDSTSVITIDAVGGSLDPSTAPTITGEYTSAATTIEGISSESAGTEIQLYQNGTTDTDKIAAVATVNSAGDWSVDVTGVTLSAGDDIYAKATAPGKSESPASDPVKILAAAPAAPSLSGTLTENTNSLDVSASAGILTIYIDDSPVGYVDHAGGATTIASTDLYQTMEVNGTNDGYVLSDQITDANFIENELYQGADVHATLTIFGQQESAESNTLTVTGVDSFEITLASPGTDKYAGTEFDIIITAKDGVGSTYTGFDGTVTLYSSQVPISDGYRVTGNFTSGTITHTIKVDAGDQNAVLNAINTADPFISGSSNSFTILNPDDVSLTSIDPTQKYRGEAQFEMTINGTNLVSSSVVRFDGSDRPTTFVSSSELKATIYESDLTSNGNYEITVYSPPPLGTGEETDPATFQVVDPPAPTIASINPTNADQYSNVDVTITGTGLVDNVTTLQFGDGSSAISINSIEGSSDYTTLTANLDINDATAQAYDVTVENPAPGGGSATLASAFTVNPVTHAGFTISNITSPQTAGQDFTVTITAVESDGTTTFTGFTGNVDLTASEGSVDPTTVGPFTSGEWTGSINVSQATASGLTVTATNAAAGQGQTGTSNSFNVDAGAADQYQVSVSDSSPEAGTDVTITAQLTDEFGNDVTTSGRTVTWSSTNGGSFASATSTTDANGTATVTFTTSGTEDTDHKITASDGNGVSGQSSTLTTTPPPHTAIAFTTAQRTFTAGGTSQYIIVELQDGAGNPTPATSEVTITLSSDSGTGTFRNQANTADLASNQLTIAEGVSSGTFKYRDQTSGTHQLTADDGTYAANQNITVNHATTSRLVLSGSGTQTAGSAQSLTITAQDTYGNTATSYTGDKSLTFSGASAAPDGTNPTVTAKDGTATNFGTATTINFASGQATVSGGSNGSMVLYKDETATVGVTDGSISENATLDVTVSPASAAAFNLAAGSTNLTTGGTTNLTITAVDAYGNTATGYTGDQTLTFSGGSAAPDGSNATVTDKSGSTVNLGSATTINFSNGVASVSSGNNGQIALYTAETATIGVADGAISESSTVDITVGPDSAAAFDLAATSTSITAGGTSDFTITAVDNYGNTATGYTGDKSLTFSGANAAPDGTNPTVSDKDGNPVNVGTSTPITFTSGVASVSSGNNGRITLYKDETANIGVTDGSISESSTLGITVGFGALEQFAWNLNSPQTNRAAFTGTNTLTAQDAYGNTVTDFDASSDNVTISNDLGGTVTSLGSGGNNVLDQAGDFASGVADLTALGMTYEGTSGSGTFTATSANNGKTGNSGSVTINPASANQLVFNSEPSATSSGSTLSNVVVEVQDADGNTITSDPDGGTTETVTLAFTTGTNTEGATLSGTKTVNINWASGTATFNDLSVDLVGSYQLTASTNVSGPADKNSASFSITAGAPAQLSFGSQPSSTTAGQTMSNVVVEVQDAAGNTVTSDPDGGTTESISLAFTTGTNTEGATLSGTASVNVNWASGTATFSDLSVDKVGSYQLDASTGMGGITDLTSNSFNITVGAAASMSVTTQPTTATAGAAIPGTPVVTMYDSEGNPVSNENITVSLNKNSFASGTTTLTTDANGEVNFSDLVIQTAATGYQLNFTTDAAGVSDVSSNTFTVDPASLDHFVVEANGGGNIGAQTAGSSFDIQIIAQDQYNNTVTGFTGTVDLSGPTFASGGGTTANFTGGELTGHSVQLNNAGTTTITATNSGAGSETGTSNSFTVNPSAASTLVITQQPIGGTGSNDGSATGIGTVDLSTQDDYGNASTVGLSSPQNVAVAINTDPSSGATLSGTTTQDIQSGSTSFADLKLDKDGTGFKVAFSSTGLSTVVSDAFNMTQVEDDSGFDVALASGGNKTAGSSFNLSITNAKDAGGSNLDGSINVIVTSDQAGDGEVHNTTVNFSSGSATVPVTLETATTHTLTVDVTGVSSDQTVGATVDPASLDNFAVSLNSPQTVGETFTGTNTLTARDEFGNTITSFDASADNVTLSTTLTGTLSGVGSGSNNVLDQAGDFSNGVADLTDLGLTFTGTAGSGTITATAGSGGSGTSGSITVNVGSTSQLAISVQPTDAQSGSAISPAVEVQLQDAGGNNVSSSGVDIDIAANQGTLSGTTTQSTNASGVASFNDLSIAEANTGYTLTATSTGLTGVTSNTFEITPGAISASNSTVTATSPVTADGTSTSTVTIALKDANNNVISGKADGDFVIGLTGDATEGTVSETGTNGTYEVTVTNTTAEVVTVTVTASGTTLDDQPTITFEAGAAASMSVTTQPATSTAGSAIAGTPVVTMVDAQGNPVSGEDVTVALNKNNFASGTTTVTTDANGEADFSDLVIETADSGYQLNFSTDAAGVTDVSSNSFTVDPAAASMLVISQQPTDNTGSGDGSATSIGNVTVETQDDYGNASTSGLSSPQDVTAALNTDPSGSATLGGTKTQDIQSGSVTFNDLTLDKDGTGFDIQFTSTGLTAVTTNTFNMSQVEDASGFDLALDVAGNKTAGDSFDLALTNAKDGTGSDLDGSYNVTVTSDQDGERVNTAINFSSGSATVPVTLTTASGHTLTVDVAPVSNDKNIGVTVDPAAVNNFVVEANGGGNIADQTAGSSFDIQITAQDSYGNTADFSGTVDLTTTNSTFASGQATTTGNFTSGVLTGFGVTLKETASNATLTATNSSGAENGTSNSFAVTDAGLDHYLVEASGGGNIADQTAGSSFDIQITAQDEFDNTVEGFTGTVDLSGPTFTSGGGTTGNFTTGQLTGHSVQINTAGTATITATNSGAGSETGSSNSFTIDAANSSQLVITQQPSDGTGSSDGSATSTGDVTVVTQDPYGNASTGGLGSPENVSISLSNDPSSGATLGGTTTKDIQSGSVTFDDLTLDKDGTGFELTISSGSLSNATTDPFDMTQVEDASGFDVALAIAGNKTAGSPFNLSITNAKDAAGSNLDGSISVTVTSDQAGDGTIFNTTTNFSSGSATVPVTLETAATHTLTINVTGVTDDQTQGVTVDPDAVSDFVVEANGGGTIADQTAGSSFDIQITAQDSYGNTADFSGTVDLTTTNSTFDTGQTTTTGNFTSGVLTGFGVTLKETASNATLTATNSSGAENGTSNSFAVSDAGLDHFVVEANGGGNIGTQTAGNSFDIQITAQDEFDNTVSGFTGTVDLSGPTFASGGGTTGNFTSGQLAGHSVQINTAGTTSITATNSGAGSETGSSNSFDVNAASASTLVITQQPTGGTGSGDGSATGIGTVNLSTEDDYGNASTVGLSNPQNVTVAVNTDPSSGATLSGTTTQDIQSGSASFADLKLNKDGTGFKIEFASTGLSTVVSDDFTMSQVEDASDFDVALAAAGNKTAGSSFDLDITNAQDGTGSALDGSIAVTVTSDQAGDGTVYNTTATFNNGSATVPVVLETATTHTLTVDVTGVSSDQTVGVTVDPAGLDNFLFALNSPQTVGEAFTGTNTLTARDEFNNTITDFDASADNVTLTTSLTGTLSGVGSGSNNVLDQAADFSNGVADLTNLGLTFTGTAGSGTITATAGSGGSGTSANITMNVGSASQLVISTQPTDAQSGVAISPAVEVQLQDAGGNDVSSSGVDIDIAVNQGTLSGTTTQSTDGSGVASFNNLSIAEANTGYTLTATSTGLTDATTNTFEITPGAISASQSSVTANPTSVEADGTSTTTLTIALKDANSNAISGQAGNIALSNLSNASESAVTETGTSGTYEVDLTNSTVEQITLTVTADGTPLNDTPTIDFVAGAADNMVVTTQPSTTSAGNSINGPPTVTVKDANGHPVSGVDVTVSVNQNSFASGTATVTTDANGEADFTDLKINTADSGYQLTFDADAAGVTNVNSNNFTITAGAADQIVKVSGDSQSKTDGSALDNPFVIRIDDAFGNPVSGEALTFAISSEPSGSTNGTSLSTTNTTTDANGEASSTLTLGDEAGSYEVTVSSGTLSDVTFTATATPSNTDPTVATNTGLTLDEGTEKTISQTDLEISDAEQAAGNITYTVSAVPANGTLKLSGTDLALNDTFTQQDINDNKLSYAHDGSETTGDSFKFTAADGQGGSLAENTFNITVTAVNDAPVIVTNTGVTVDEGNAGTIGQTELEVTDDEQSAANLTYTVDNNVSNGTLKLDGVNLSGGDTFTQDDIDNNKLTYQHDGTETTSDSFDFTLSDGNGGSIGATTFSITVNTSNDTPVLATNDGISVDEGNTVTIPQGKLEVTDEEQSAANITYTVDSDVSNGTLKVNGTGISNGDTFTQQDINNSNLTYEHDGSETNSDSFDFTVSDGNGGSIAATTFSITVNAVNDTPVLAANNGLTLDEGTEKSITSTELEVTDVEQTAGSITYTVSNVPANGDLKLNGTALSNTDTFTQQDIVDDNLSYEHDGSETTSDSFDFTVSDGAGGSIAATTFNISVTPVNNDPVLATNTGITVDEGEAGTIAQADLEVTDAEQAAGDITYTVDSNVSNGTVKLDGVDLSDGDTFTQDDIDNNKVTYQHDGTETTSDSFDFTVSDGNGGSIAATTFNITVNNTTTVDQLTIVSGNNQSKTAGQALDNALVVKALDAQGNVEKDVSITFAIDQEPGSGASLSTTSETTNASGQASTALTLDTETGTYKVTASAAGVPDVQFTATATPDAADAGNALITANDASITADGTSTTTITVQLKDQYGNNLDAGGDNVTLSTDAGSLSGVTDENDGTYTATLTSSTSVETATITGEVNSAAITDQETVDFTVGGFDLAESTISVDKTTITADGADASNVTVQLIDANGNDITTGGETVVISTDLGNITATSDENDGSYTATLTSTNTGTATISATINGSAITSGDPTVTIESGAISASNSSVTANPNTVTADGTTKSTVTIALKDAHNNVISGEAANISLSGLSNATAGAVSETGTAGTYEVDLTNTTAEDITISVDADGTTLDDTPTISFVPGVISASNSSVTANPTSLTADGTTVSTVTIALKDANNNAVSGEAGNINLSGLSNATAGTVNETGTAGTYQVDLTNTVAEDISVAVEADGTTLDDTPSISFTSGNVDAGNSVVNATSPHTADGTDASTVTIELKDANNNAISGLTNAVFNIAVTGDASVGTVSETGTAGTYEVEVTNTTAEDVTVTVTADGTTLNDAPSITFDAGAAADLAMVSGNNQTDEVASTLGNSFVVAITDADGNPVSGETVNFTISSEPNGASGSSLSSSSVTTDANGEASTNLTLGDVTGTYDVTVSSGTLTDVRFSATATPGAADAGTSIITAATNSITADGTSTTTVTVQLKDQYGNNLDAGGDNVTLSTDAGSLSGVTDENDGTYTATLTSSTTVETATITGEVNSAAITDQETVDFTVGGFDLAESTISVDKTTITADGTDASNVTVQLKDANGNDITTGGETVVIATDLGDITATTDENDGSYTATLTSTNTGTAELSATINGSAITSGNPTVTVEAGSISASKSTVSATSPHTADGTDAATVTIQLKDANSNVIGGLSNNDFTLNVTGDASTGTISETGTSGTYEVDLTNTTAENVTITVIADGVTLDDTPTVTFESGTASSLTLVSGNNQSDTVTSTLAQSLVVELNDGQGNPVSGEDISFSISGQPTGAAASLSATSVTTDANGQATVDLTLGTITGDYEVTASYGSLTDVIFDATANPGAADADKSLITANPASITADGSSTSTITVQLRDQYENKLTVGGETVTLSTDAGSLSGVTDENDGTYTATLTASTNVETATIEGALNSSAISDKATVNFVASTTPENIVFVQQPTDTQAGEAIQPAVTIQLQDDYDNDVAKSGVDITLTFDSGTWSGTLTQTTDANGQAEFNDLVQTVAGTYTITPTANGLNSTPSDSFDIQPGPADEATSTVVANPTSIQANGTSTSTVTVTLFDEYGNKLSSGGETVTMIMDVGQLSSVTDNGDGTYTAIFTSPITVGTANITARLNGADIQDDAAIDLLPGDADVDNSTITANPGSITADGVTTSTITVQLVDVNGNNLDASGGTVTLATTAGSISAVTDNSDGTYSATLTSSTSVEAATITGQLDGNDLSDDASVTFTSGVADAATSTITANPTEITADGSSTATITVQLKDAHGNNLSAGGDNVTLNTTVGTLGSVTDNGDGTYEATLTSATEKGSAEITGTLNGTAITDQANVSMVSGNAASIAYTFGESQQDTVAQTLSDSLVVQVTDDNGNAVGGATVEFSINTTPADAQQQTLSHSQMTTDGDGRAYTKLTLGTKSGDYSVIAEVGSSLADTTKATAIPDVYDLDNATMGAQPTEIVADGTSSSTIELTLRDQYGNLVNSTGLDVDFATTAGTLGDASNDDNGTVTIPLTSSTELATAEVSATVAQTEVSDKATVNFTVGTIASITLEDANDGSGEMYVEALNIKAGTALRFYAIGRDAQGHFVDKIAADEWMVESLSGSYNTEKLSVADDNESAQAEPRGVGQFRITVKDAQYGSFTTDTITVSPNVPNQLVKLYGDNQKQPTRSTLNDSLVVQLSDAYGNAISGDTVLFAVDVAPDNSSDFSVTPSQMITDDQGKAFTKLKLGNEAGMYEMLAQLKSDDQVSTKFGAEAIYSAPDPSFVDTVNTIVFNGSSEVYAYAEDDITLNPNSDFSIEMWTLPKGVNEQGNLIAKWNENNPDDVNNQFRVYLKESTLYAELRLEDGSTISLQSKEFVKESQTKGKSNEIGNKNLANQTYEWAHLALVWNGQNQQVELYHNGFRADQKSISGQLNSSDERMIVGKAFDGEIHEIRFWNSNRTRTDIQAFKDLILSPQSDGLDMYHTFDEDDQEKAPDLTDQKNDLYFTDGVTRNFSVRNVTEVQMLEDESFVNTFKALDAAGGTIAVEITRLPEHGTLYQYDGGSQGAELSGSNESLVDDENRAIYQPDAYFNGLDSLKFRMTDKYGNTAEATRLLRVLPVNNVPQLTLRSSPQRAWEFNQRDTMRVWLDTLTTDPDHSLSDLSWSARVLTPANSASQQVAANDSVSADELSSKMRSMKPGIGSINTYEQGSASHGPNTHDNPAINSHGSTTDSLVVSVDEQNRTIEFTTTPRYVDENVQVEITATDPEGASTVDTAYVTVHYVNAPPEPFDLISPAPVTKLDTLGVTMVWESTQDLEHEEIRYTLHVTRSDGETRSWAGLTDTTKQLYNSEFLDYSYTYSWFVTATDQKADVQSNTTFDFDTPGEAPDRYSLKQNYPNPFNPSTNIEYWVPVNSRVIIKVYNVVGQEVATIVNRPEMVPGTYEARWDARQMASGLYFYQMIAVGLQNGERYIVTKKMTLVQ
ncbi:MAG: invasin domain 3-containing protein [Bacteroidota bacterium]